MNKEKIEKLIRDLLIELGEDPDRDGLVKTPTRVASLFEFITSGNRMSLKKVVNDAIFTQEHDSMIILKNIEIYSTCEHHLLPFFGKCHIGYIPKKKVIGISKIARIVDMYARRLQIQERLTGQIARAIMEATTPVGVGVIIEAQHLCMMMRGVEKQNSIMTTSEVLGTFRSNNATRDEFLSFIKAKE
jgi:GTP cyclohydrolase I